MTKRRNIEKDAGIKKKDIRFKSIDEAYTKLFPKLCSLARQRLVNPNQAIDAVHDAFTKLLEYREKKGTIKINVFILAKELTRACKRYNKQLYIETNASYYAQNKERVQIAREIYTGLD